MTDLLLLIDSETVAPLPVLHEDGDTVHAELRFAGVSIGGELNDLHQWVRELERNLKNACWEVTRG